MQLERCFLHLTNAPSRQPRREQSCWEFMRERTDKNLPNAEHVFRSVVKSIEDNIQVRTLEMSSLKYS